MPWGDELWDQEKPIAAYTDNNIEFLNKTRKFYESIAGAHVLFAKEIHKIVKSFQEPAPKVASSNFNSFATVLQETDFMANQHEFFCEKIMLEVCEPLKVLAKDLKAGRIKKLQELATCQGELEKARKKYEKVKAAFEKATKDSQDAQMKYNKAQTDDNSTKAKIDKAKQDAEKAARDAEQAKNDLRLETDILNKAQRNHFSEEVKKIFNDMQYVEQLRVTQHTARMKSLTKIFRDVIVIFNQSLDTMDKTFDAVNPGADTQAFLESVKTGFSYPSDLPMEGSAASTPATPGSLSVQQINERRVNKKKFFATTARKKTAIREDFGHLPPEQRRKAIMEKLAELEAEHQKELKTHAAMMKTVELYTVRPDLGDPKAIEKAKKEIAMIEQKLERIDGDSTKFKLYLAAMDRGDDPLARRDSQASLSPSHTSGADHIEGEGDFAEEGDFDSHEEEEVPAYATVGSPATYQQQPQQQQQQQHHHHAPPPPAAGPQMTYARAMYDFAGSNPGELRVTAGDRLGVLENDGSGWLRASLGGNEGYVPLSYVQFE